uniref:Centromere protein H n=1 Tax=Nannospalax galili TaxID=1026970 RepID=A0A8C6RWG2_NANGA
MEQLREEQAAEEAADPGGERSGDRSEDRICLLLRLRAQTKQQLLEYKSMIDANEERTPEQIMQENQIEAKIEDLENEIEDVKSTFEMRNLALNRPFLKIKIKDKGIGDLENMNIKKRLQLKQASGSKLSQLQMEKNKQKEDLESMKDSDMIKTMQKNLQKEIEIATVVQHVFQALILGSKTNWAEDSAFKEIVLQLEKNLTTI